MDYNNFYIYLTTRHVYSFKILINLLKDIVREVNLIITPKELNNCLEIITIDKNGSILIKIKIFGDCFDDFICNSKEQVFIGIDIKQLSNLLSSVNKDDILTFFITDINKIEFNIKIENASKTITTISKTKIINIENNIIFKFEESKYPFVVSFDSMEFRKIIKSMSSNSEVISIDLYDFENDNDKNYQSLIFNTKSEIETRQTIISNFKTSSNELKKIDFNNCKKIKNNFEIKNLLIFSKCYNLSPNIDIFIKEDFPLVLKYKITNFGLIYICVSPISDFSNESSKILNN